MLRNQELSCSHGRGDCSVFSINPLLLQALMVRNRLLPCSGAGGKLRMVVSEAGEWGLCSVVEDCTVPLRRAQPGPDSSQMWTGSMKLAPANTPVTLLQASSFQLSEVGVAPRSCALSPFQRAGTEMGDLSETPNSHVSLLAKGNTQPCICSENHSLC